MIPDKKFLRPQILLIALLMPASIVAQIEPLKFETPPVSDAQKESPRETTPKSQPTSPDDLIHFGDLIDVDLVGSIEYDWRGRLTPEGFLSGLKFAGDEIYAVCLSTSELESVIAERYSKFLKKPEVSVRIVDRSKRPLSRLFGAVKKPFRFRIRREVRLSELIILAGGVTDKASGKIQIIRQKGTSCAVGEQEKQALQRKPDFGTAKVESVSLKKSGGSNVVSVSISDLLKGKAKANPKIYYGDIITVLQAEPVYVIGAVVNPSKLLLRKGLTVSRAIASSGGVAKGGKTDGVTIFRRTESGTKILSANLDEIKAGREDDIPLLKLDVVEVEGKTRRKNKRPPVVEIPDARENTQPLPLRIID